MSKFNVGDKAQVSQDHPSEIWRGLIGTVTWVSDMDHWVHIQLEDQRVGGFLGEYLTLVKDNVEVVLKEEDVKVGMEIEITIVSDDMVMINRGLVDRITTEFGNRFFKTKAGRQLNFSDPTQKIALLSQRDLLAEELASLKGGSVVQREYTAGGSTLTFSYVKGEFGSTAQGFWLFFNPSSKISSIVEEKIVLKAIRTKGAEIVVRK